jgi:FtsZ-binding cell division protein ZapB
MLCDKIKQQIDEIVNSVNNIDELSEEQQFLLQNLQNQYKNQCKDNETNKIEDYTDNEYYNEFENYDNIDKNSNTESD